MRRYEQPPWAGGCFVLECACTAGYLCCAPSPLGVHPGGDNALSGQCVDMATALFDLVVKLRSVLHDHGDNVAQIH